MRIFICSDPHGRNDILVKTINEVKNGEYDVFLGLGDYISSRFFSRLVTGIDVKKKSFIRGNRDFGINLPYLKKFDTFDYDGIRFVMVGSHHFPNLKEKILDACEDVDGDELIIASHEPPHRLRDEIRSGVRVGVPEFREIIEEKQPLVWLCGHIHEAGGVSTLGSTKIVNASAYDGVFGYRMVVEGKEIKEIKRLGK